ncbi:MAG: rRNA maturation RNase YbeY [Actinobacteria bacterium]|nr:rRNA maturation RNase YbeY [Actinomycetota bacterium]
MNIEITNLASLKCDESRIKSVASYSLEKLGMHPDCELSISLVEESEMSSLHMQWMDEQGPTDVLSFPMDEMKPNSAALGPGVLGDIVLCPSYAEAQAEKAGHSLQEELELLTVHGVLHLLGFDHRESEEERVMFSMQDEYLKGWRIQI